MKAVYVSGGFDPIHEGHLDYLQEAKKLGSVYILLNSDEWLKRKKGYVFQTWETRARILRAMGYACYEVDDSDGTVCDGISKYTSLLRGVHKEGMIFAKGGDRTSENTPEQDVCKQLGIEVVFGVGGGKVASSSDLVAAIRRKESTPCVYEDVT